MGFFKGLAKAGKAILKVAIPALKVAPYVLPAFGIPIPPLLGTVINGIFMAQEKGGTGEEKFKNAVDYILTAAPMIIDQIERTFGVDVPEEAIEKFVGALTQATVDLMNTTGMLPHKGR